MSLSLNKANGCGRFWGDTFGITVPMNGPALSEFRYLVVGAWKRALSRRSQTARLTWERMYRLARHWLPYPRIYHPYPSQRLVV